MKELKNRIHGKKEAQTNGQLKAKIKKLNFLCTYFCQLEEQNIKSNYVEENFAFLHWVCVSQYH
jgi:hypothetical protein